jgi:hypothetical protein
MVASRLGRALVAIRRSGVIAEAVFDHYRARWGEPSRRARFEVEGLGIDVLKWDAEASPEEAALYATVGASTWPLNGRDPEHRVEFFAGLLPEQDGIASALGALGLYHVRERLVLDHGHTVPAGGPLWPGTAMDSLLVMRPRAGFLPALQVPNGVHVEYLQAIPIYESDRAFKAEHGAEALLRRWERERVQFWDPNRADTLAV